MARLPVIGQDVETWGQILNDFLRQSHNNDGTLKSDVVGSAALQSDSVGAAGLKNGSVTVSKLSAKAGVDGNVLTKDSTVSGGLSWATGAGPSTPNGPAGGDLAGTYPNPTVPGLANKANDAAVVHMVGNETISGVKNFSDGVQAGGQSVITTTDSRLNDQRTPLDNSVTTTKVIDGTITESKLSSSVQTKLNTQAPVTSVAGKTGNVTLTGADVGLGNVSNVRLTASSTPPASPTTGDVWIDTSA